MADPWYALRVASAPPPHGRHDGIWEQKPGKLFDPSAQSAINDKVQRKIATDLERQYDRGVQLKKDSQHGRHSGLGFADS